MSESILRVEKLENGYTVSVRDPVIQKKNQTAKGAWIDPEKEYAFKTAKEVADFVAKNLDSLEPPMTDDEMYKEAFGDATDKEED